MSGTAFSLTLVEAWRRDGWCVFEQVIPASDLAAAQSAVARLFPSAEEMDGDADDDRITPWRTWDAAWPEFPFRSTRLNKLVVHDVVIDLACELLGTEDVRLYLALVSAKYAHQSSGYNQLLHADYPNHSLVVPRGDAGYQHLETFIYLNDVSTRNGATRMVSRTKTQTIPVEQHTLNLAEYAHLYDDPGEAAAPAGSIVAYSPDVYHRSVDVNEAGQARFMLHVAYRPASLEWIGYQAWPIRGFSPDWHKFVAQASVRQLTVLGFPKPGDPYWTRATLDGVSARYPDLDMSPWRVGAREGVVTVAKRPPRPWIEALKTSQERLARLVTPMGGDGLRSASMAADWSVAQVLSHLGSGAEIFSTILAAARDGLDLPGPETFPVVWDAWNARSPEDQRRDSIASGRAFVQTVDGMSDAELADLRFALFGMDLDATGFLQMRLSELAVHTWDVAAALDGSATVSPDAVDLLVDTLPELTRHIGKAGDTAFQIGIATSDPDRRLVLEVGDSVRLDMDPEGVQDAVLRMPAEALLRLVYGRLDENHSPALELKGAEVTLDMLRATFPGM